MTGSNSTQLAWLRNYAKTNPLLALWSLMLFCGGSVLLSYHADLAYLPDFSLVDLAGLMASVTLIGLMLVALFLFACFAPALTLRLVEHRWPLIPYTRYFTFREIVTLWMISLAVWAGYLLSARYLPTFVSPAVAPYVLLAGILLAAIVAALSIARRTTARFSLRHWNRRLIVRHGAAFAIWIALFAFPLNEAIKLAAAIDPNWEIPFVIGTILFLTIFNGAVYAASFDEIRRALGIKEFAALLLVALLLGLATVFPRSIMQSLALGHRNAVTLTVTGESCHALTRFGVPCTGQDGKLDAIELENVNILSRVGTTVLLELLVRATHDDIDTPLAVRDGILKLPPQHRRSYRACDPRLLKRMQSPGGLATLEEFRRDLVCVQLTIPKAGITNIVFGGQRWYSGYSSVKLPARTAD